MTYFKIKNTKDMGRGLFSTKKIRKGTTIEVSPCINFDRKDEENVQECSLKFYVFRGESGANRGSVLALGFGSLFNHKKESNVTYSYSKELNSVIFKTTRTVAKGEQFFIDYGYDPVVCYESWKSQNRNPEKESRQLGRALRELKSDALDQDMKLGEISQEKLKELPKQPVDLVTVDPIPFGNTSEKLGRNQLHVYPYIRDSRTTLKSRLSNTFVQYKKKLKSLLASEL